MKRQKRTPKYEEVEMTACYWGTPQGFVSKEHNLVFSYQLDEVRGRYVLTVCPPGEEDDCLWLPGEAYKYAIAAEEKLRSLCLDENPCKYVLEVLNADREAKLRALDTDLDEWKRMCPADHTPEPKENP